MGGKGGGGEERGAVVGGTNQGRTATFLKYVFRCKLFQIHIQTSDFSSLLCSHHAILAHCILRSRTSPSLSRCFRVFRMMRALYRYIRPREVSGV